VYLVRPLLRKVGLEGTLRNGPNSYRVGYVCIMMPSYSTILLCVGALFGRYQYFRRVVLRMYGRFLPASLRNKIFGPTTPPPPSPPV